MSRSIVVLDAGPRVLGYSRRGGPQLFASLPGEVIEQPGGAAFSFVGGHRLWRAPEVPRVTYRSDSYPVAIDRLDRGVRLTGAPDGEGVAKTISLHQRGAITVVDHTLLNAGRAPIRCAAWAITQLTPGGVAVLPQPLAPLRPRRRPPQPSDRVVAIHRSCCTRDRAGSIGSSSPRLGDEDAREGRPAQSQRLDRLCPRRRGVHQVVAPPR